MPPTEKPNPIPKEVILVVYRALCIGILACRQLLNEASPLFYERLVEAATTQGVSMWNDRRGHLHDPIEDQEEFKQVLQEAGQLALAEIQRDSPGSIGRMGSCHLFWHIKKRILHEQYDIEWFPPSEMNPHVIYD